MTEETFNATYLPAGAALVTPSCPTCCTHDHQKEAANRTPIEVNTANEFMLAANTDRVAPLAHPVFTTKQSAYRFIAWLECMAEMLPDETPADTLEDVRQAIRNT
jgi:hypothetical protein